MSTHRHKCGYHFTEPEPDEPDESEGCGHVWSHRLPWRKSSREKSRQRHCCPKCGKGPWRWVFEKVVEPTNRKETIMTRTKSTLTMAGGAALIGVAAFLVITTLTG